MRGLPERSIVSPPRDSASRGGLPEARDFQAIQFLKTFLETLFSTRYSCYEFREAPMPRPLADALTFPEFDELAAFFAGCKGGDAMNLEELDGFFSALIAGPDVVLPSEYWPVVLGGQLGAVAQFESVEEANRLIQLFMRHWNTIATALDRGEGYDLYFLRNASHLVTGADWADGFRRGVEMRYALWEPLINSKRHGEAILPMMTLTQEKDPELRPYLKPMSSEIRFQLLAKMTIGLTDIHRYFRDRRSGTIIPERPRQTVRRASPKVGRNEPCPCGSGKKFKVCCGADDASPLH